MRTRAVALTIETLVLLASGAWLYESTEWEPLITFLSALLALIGTAAWPHAKERGGMQQRGGRGSRNYQAKGDINIH